MGILSKFRQAVNTSDGIENKVVLANGKVVDRKDVEDPTAKFATPRHIGVVYGRGQKRKDVDFFQSEYDLPMLANAVQLDGILRRAVSLYVEHILKNGYEFTSREPKIQKHVTRRIKEIQQLTSISFQEIMTQVSYQLASYANAYIIKHRVPRRSQFGRKYRLFGKTQNPIVGLFVADASTMEIGLDSNNHIIQYIQRIRGEERIFDARDVIHLTYNKIPGTLTGMSSLIPVLDDVRALRKLEEEVEILGFQYAIPLYLYKVGNKDIPPAPGEVDEVSSVVTNMPSYGMLVVPGHHDISVPSNSNDTIDIIKYADHFKQRIYGGLGVNPVMFGESSSSNRNTAEVSDSIMQTTVKAYQNIIKNKIELELIRELMLDGGFNKPDDEMEFHFPEIDIENQIKKETHIISLWQNNLVTRSEARNKLDLDTNLDEKDTFFNLITVKQVEAEGEVAKDVEKSKPAASDKTATKKKSNSTDNKVRPSNQHGKSTGRPKYVKDFYEMSNIFNLNEKLNNCLVSHYEEVTKKLNDSINYYKDKLRIDDIDINQRSIHDFAHKAELFLRGYLEDYNKNREDTHKSNIADRQLINHLIMLDKKIDNFAQVAVKEEPILINSKSGCHKEFYLDQDKISYDGVPPINYKCECYVTESN